MSNFEKPFAILIKRAGMNIKKNIPVRLMGLAVTLFFLFIPFTKALDFTEFVEMKAFDLRSRLTAPRERHPVIELVTISGKELEEFGPWPWSRDIFAQGINNLAMAGARVIALNVEFREPEGTPGLRAVKDLKESFDNLGLAQKGPGLTFYQKLSQAEQDLDNDTKLYKAIKRAGNVVLPIHFDLSDNTIDSEAPDYIVRHSFKQISGFDNDSAVTSVTWLKKLSPFLPSLAEVAASIGYNNLFPDKDGHVRSQEHALGYLKDILFPSYPLAIAKIFYGLKDEDIRVTLKKGIELRVGPSSSMKVPVIDNRMKTLLNWYSGPGIAFHRTPFSKVYKNQIQTSLFKDKIVIIGPTAPGAGERFVTPISGQLPGVELVANSVADIIDQRFFSRPGWISVIEVGLLILFGFFISLILPQLKPGLGAITTLGLILAFGIISTLFLFSQNIWIKISPHLLLLVVGFILITAARFTLKERVRDGAGADLRARNRMQGIPNYDENIPAPGMAGTIAASGSNGGALTGTRSVIGGYKIIEELGRGDIEVIYKGVEPRIHRTVTIDTVSFSGFDENALDKIRGSFFMEAESARRLKHPNIAAVYDAGEEQDLMYLATEFLEGETLEEYTKIGSLLPLREALSIVALVADVLDFAHGRGIIHGSIKPSCIVRLEGTGEVKVTDFGMGGTRTALKTKTGNSSGIPFYMSPEQVLGNRVDGRSDIFSLGVVLFELLSGTRPFAGGDIESIINNVLREKHPPVRAFNPLIPGVVAKIIDKALEKEAGKRYQAANRMAEHLKRVVSKIDEIQGRRRARLSGVSSGIPAQTH